MKLLLKTHVKGYTNTHGTYVTEHEDRRTKKVESSVSTRPIHQTETKAFKEWFGESKVVDGDGKPLVVYHGTFGGFEAFDMTPSRLGYSDLEGGVEFTDSIVVASHYAGASPEMMPYAEDAGSVYSVYLQIEKPLTVPREIHKGLFHVSHRIANNLRLVANAKMTIEDIEAYGLEGLEDEEGIKELVLHYLKKHGNPDGIIVEEADWDARSREENTQYIVFSPTQIKSATGNRGTFDPSEPDITKSTMVKAHVKSYVKNALRRLRLFFKASLRPGEKWITVNGGSGEGTGQHVLVRESQSQPGVHHVVGGLGGKVQLLKLDHVKSQATYQAEKKDKAKAKRVQAQAQFKRDKELGLVKTKKAALSALKTDTHKRQRAVVDHVAKLKGWTDYDLDPDKLEGLSDRAKDAAMLRHHRKLHQDAQAVVKATRENLILDSEARAEAELGELSIHRDEPGVIGLSDLSHDPKERGLGFNPDYGPVTDEIQEEADDFKAERAAARSPEQQAGLDRMQEASKAIREEVANAEESGQLAIGERDTSGVQPREAVGLLALDKQTKKTIEHTQARQREIKGATSNIQAKGYVVEAEPVSAKDVLEKLSGDSAERTRQDQATSFLNMVEHDPFGEEPEDHHAALLRHIRIGSASMFSRVSQQLTGTDILPREVVDVLGTGGAAQAVAKALRDNFPEEQLEQWKEQLASHHIDNQGDVTEEAVAQAKEKYEAAQAMIAESVENPTDLTAANELNEKRIELLSEARQILGTTLGEMEAMGALNFALASRPESLVRVSMGGVSTETAIRQLKALGLEKDDYDIDSDGTNHFALVSQEGLGRVVKPVDKEEAEHLQVVNDILDGKHDEEGWLPAGFANRPETSFTDPEKQAVSFAQQYEFSPQGTHDEDLETYIGQRMADGHAAEDIYKDLFTSKALNQMPESEHDAYFQALERIAPLHDEHGKHQDASVHQPAWEALSEKVLEAKYGHEAIPLHKQRINTDKKASYEAIHRVLAKDPARGAAFVALGDLTAQDQATLRHTFETRFAEPESMAATKEAVDALGPVPDKKSESMFGEIDNPEHHKYQRDLVRIKEDAKERGLNWDKYVNIHGSREHAYQALQDILKGEAVKDFVKSYGRVSGEPLKLGRTKLTNNLAHLGAVNPAAREKQLEEQRKTDDKMKNRTSQGQYAVGGIKAKRAAVRQQAAITNQNQRSLYDAEFGDGPLKEDERHTLGHTAESQLAAMWHQVARNFDPQRPVSLINGMSMSGKYKNQQRAVKYIEHNKRVALALGTGSGKAQPFDAKILTPAGWVLMGDIQVGDLVIAGDGTPTEVLGVFPQGEKDIYTITMSDGASTRSCDEHLWLTHTAKGRKNIHRGKLVEKWLPRVRSLREIKQSLSSRGYNTNHLIPMVTPVQFGKQDYPLDPYLVGVLLGDGCLAAHDIAKVSLPDSEIMESVEKLLPAGIALQQEGASIDYRLTTGTRGGVPRKNPLLNSLRSLGLMGKKAEAKAVPPLYKFNAIDVRIAMLQGLMDTDGHVDTKGCSSYFDTASKQLSEDISFLVQSLGGVTSCNPRLPTYTYNGEKKVGQLSYRMVITMPATINPFRLPRKRDRVIPKTKYPPRRFIAEVSFWEKAQAQCILIDHPSHLYVTDDFIVTHNTAIGMGAFTNLHDKGLAKRAFYAVPSIVQGQFGSEAASMLEPGKYSWWGKPGASQEERIEAYKDKKHHMIFATHQALRDDLVHLMAKKEGVTESDMAERFQGMTEEAQNRTMKETLDGEGINPDFLTIDEGHLLLDRNGKPDSLMSNVFHALGQTTPYYVSASADPIRNDLSELFSQLHKLNPKKFNSMSHFMGKYGLKTNASQDVLKRELRRYLLPGKVDPGVDATYHEEPISLTDHQQAAYDSVLTDYRTARQARQAGKLDIPAAKRLSPSSFENQADDLHAGIAEGIHSNLAIARDGALSRVLDNTEPINNAKSKRILEIANQYKEQGKPGIIFARSLTAVAQISKMLKDEGHRVGTITGSDSSKDKARRISGFRPPKGQDAKYDVMVLSDAAATGANLQRGSWVIHQDIPDKAMTYRQRIGRIHRLGQKNHVHVHSLESNTVLDAKNRQRLQRKDALRDELTAPYESLSDEHSLYAIMRERDE